jgi:hypothetical protein
MAPENAKLCQVFKQKLFYNAEILCEEAVKYSVTVGIKIKKKKKIKDSV